MVAGPGQGVALGGDLAGDSLHNRHLPRGRARQEHPRVQPPEAGHQRPVPYSFRQGKLRLTPIAAQHGGLTRLRTPRPQGSPPGPYTLGAIPLRGSQGPWARGATRPAFSSPCGSGRRTGGLRHLGDRGRPEDSRHTRPLPGSYGCSGAGNSHIFSKFDVVFPCQVWSSQIREAKSRGQVKRTRQLLLSVLGFAAQENLGLDSGGQPPCVSRT